MKYLYFIQGVDTNRVGWVRDDLPVPMVHVIAEAFWGHKFLPTDGQDKPHWPCEVCRKHGYTEQDFNAQLTQLLALSGANTFTAAH